MAFNFDEFEDYSQKKIYPSSRYDNPGKKKYFRRVAAKFHSWIAILYPIVKHGNQYLLLKCPGEQVQEKLGETNHYLVILFKVKKPHVLADEGDLFDADVLAELLLELKVFETMVLSSTMQQMVPIASQGSCYLHELQL
ncbi:hypothetical protein PoB_000253000 [Plakobranchus ocellatus]|uniref:Uncharacterized protein n=1 Tax=Plakobranchus ocellatus TaxID=259542 RepID=A0AAV3XYW7_9GAST|nr:hypothetical protein PoB_000253000 [Plakobranchus ocellatus]